MYTLICDDGFLRAWLEQAGTKEWNRFKDNPYDLEERNRERERAYGK